MQPRMKNPAFVLPGAMEALRGLGEPIAHGGVPRATIELVHLRASQINGCSVCVDMHARSLLKHGEATAKVVAVSAWREAPYFSDAERAALDLAEAVTRLSDRPDAVSDAIWNEAARHYDEKRLAALVMAVAAVNVWNRLNAATRQVGGDWTAQYV
jgi:AhpD family alkylhydroperoxidase